MNLLILKEKLLKLGERIGLEVQEESKESVVFHTTIVAQEYFTAPVYCRFIAFVNGTIHFFLTFDQMEKTTDKLFLINNFNDSNPWFKGYITNINNKDFFELHYSSYCLSSEIEAIDTFGFLLNALLEEPTLNDVKTILEND